VPDLGAYVRGLEAALRSLQHNPSARTSVRRLARSMAHAAESAADVDTAERARRVQFAEEIDLEQATLDLLTHVERSSAPPPPAHELEVLLVEDNLTVATTVHAYLKRQARRVHVAASAREAEALLATHPIDVVVLDLILPDGDGRDLLIQIRENPLTASLPVIVLSGERSGVARAECLAVGASEFLPKPPDPKALRIAVARHVTARSVKTPTTSVPKSVADVGRPARVLVVEDDPVTSALIRHRLEREGLEVACFANGEDAFRQCGTASFGLAVLDVKVPGMDGFELLGRLRATPVWAEVPIVMLTALGGEDDVVRGLALGADDYMIKPFSPAELLARVRRLLPAPSELSGRTPTPTNPR